MIIIEQKILEFDGVQTPIKAWEVWFRTMRGLHRSLDDALKHAEELEMPPELIIPVTVAVGENGQYEAIYR